MTQGGLRGVTLDGYCLECVVDGLERWSEKNSLLSLFVSGVAINALSAIIFRRFGQLKKLVSPLLGRILVLIIRVIGFEGA